MSGSSGIIITHIVHKRDTEANWILNNPILLAGEFAVTTDNWQFKIGDGTRHWDALPYFSSGSGGIGGTGTSGTSGSSGLSDVYIDGGNATTVFSTYDGEVMDSGGA